MKKPTRIIGLLAALACLLLLAVGPALAAKPAPTPDGTGTLTGKVTIAGTRTVIVGASVTAIGAAGTYAATTDSKGIYILTPPAGDYNVTATAAGYNNQTFAASVKSGTKTTLNFTLSVLVATTGTLNGTVTDASSGAAIAGALVAADHGGYSATTDNQGKYLMEVAAGTYDLTASADGYLGSTQSATVAAGQTTVSDFALAAVAAGLDITSLTATPDQFLEAAAATVSLSAIIDGTPTAFTWTQVDGPKVPLTALSATAASADISALEIAAECELLFELSVSDGSTSISKTVTVLALPADMTQYPAENVQIGGSTSATARFQYGGAEWCLFNIGTGLRATPVGMTKGVFYEVTLPNIANDIEILDYNGQIYALIACGTPGVAVVNITDPASMSLVSVLPVNFYMDGIIFAEGGGSILYDNIFESIASPIVALSTDGINLYLGNHDFGIHKTSLANVFGNVREADGTLLIDQEVCTVQPCSPAYWRARLGRPLLPENVRRKALCRSRRARHGHLRSGPEPGRPIQPLHR